MSPSENSHVPYPKPTQNPSPIRPKPITFSDFLPGPLSVTVLSVSYAILLTEWATDSRLSRVRKPSPKNPGLGCIPADGICIPAPDAHIFVRIQVSCVFSCRNRNRVSICEHARIKPSLEIKNCLKSRKEEPLRKFPQP